MVRVGASVGVAGVAGGDGHVICREAVVVVVVD